MISGNVNLLAVLVATIVSFLISFFWYSKSLFGKQWMKLAKVKPAKEGMAKSAVLGFITMFIMLYVLANVLVFAGVSNVAGGLSGGLVLWIGFIATVTLGTVLWEQKPMQLWVINAGHYLVVFLIAGIILGAWM